MLEQDNTKIQGTVGLGQAIAYFTGKGIITSLPLNDSQPYDLVIDTDTLHRVSVKTTTYVFKRTGVYQVHLKTSGGTRKVGTSKPFDPQKCDYLFVLCGDHTKYLIPSKAITSKTTLDLGKKYASYRLGESN